MQSIATSEFCEWAKQHEIVVSDSQQVEFADCDISFRIPIGDYQNQLDHRILYALRAVIRDSETYLVRRSALLGFEFGTPPDGDFHPMHFRPLGAIERALWSDAKPAVTKIAANQLEIIFSLAYLTNRWGTSSDSIYVIPTANPQAMLYFPGSPESCFVRAKSLEVHDAIVAELRSRNIPAFGPYIENPLPLPRYKDFAHGKQMIRVDPNTGKVVGPGSAISVLLPDFVSPEELWREQQMMQRSEE